MHSYVRTAAGTAALAAVLLLTGCSSDSGKGDGATDKGKPTGSAPSAGASATGGASTPPAGDAGAGSVDGEWAATTDGKLVALSVHDGMAGIAGENICSGTVSRQGTVTLSLKCANGDTARSKGTATPGPDGKTLTVKWEGSGIEDTFTKAPANGLPSGIPTDLPSMPKLPGS
ncbi:hypothetical protein OG897_38995 [Streptomyces sp. NBC_00237]|uniref:hypothetical protein n=1 Tax=Streptomyces sp. NBC_00237 TaxID=2975687 RepID=UPI002250DF57|nr:hypothetical protein [Streptomyces sp. NBC_00237]MCX5207377.1 hypothetical protein [Streptomyces sp. NBC_00237]